MELGLLLFFLFLTAAALTLAAKTVRVTMEKQMTAERNRRALVLQAEGERQANITRAEGEKQSAILAAEGAAAARLRQAEAESEAIGQIARAMLDHGNPAQYLITQRYIESLKEMSKGNNAKVIFMPVETSTMLSSVGAIKEVLSRVGEDFGSRAGTESRGGSDRSVTVPG